MPVMNRFTGGLLGWLGVRRPPSLGRLGVMLSDGGQGRDEERLRRHVSGAELDIGGVLDVGSYVGVQAFAVDAEDVGDGGAEVAGIDGAEALGCRLHES